MVDKEPKVIVLREVPIIVTVSGVAEGVYETFTPEEKEALQFGLLPAKKMEIVAEALRKRFEKCGSRPKDVFPPELLLLADKDEDTRVSMHRGEPCEWNLNIAVSEAMHEITLGILDLGNLVV